MIQNRLAAVTSGRTEVGKQATFFAKQAKGFDANNAGYRREPERQNSVARSRATTGSTPSALPAGNPTQRNAQADAQNAVNKVTLTGRLGRDAAVRDTKSGKVVANFSVGVDESYKDRLGEWQKKTSWYRVQAWGELAETVSANFRAGAGVHVEGRLINRSWIDRQNSKHFSTEIVANDVRFLDEAPRGGAANEGAFSEEHSAAVQ